MLSKHILFRGIGLLSAGVSQGLDGVRTPFVRLADTGTLLVDNEHQCGSMTLRAECYGGHLICSVQLRYIYGSIVLSSS